MKNSDFEPVSIQLGYKGLLCRLKERYRRQTQYVICVLSLTGMNRCCALSWQMPPVDLLAAPEAIKKPFELCLNIGCDKRELN